MLDRDGKRHRDMERHRGTQRARKVKPHACARAHTHARTHTHTHTQSALLPAMHSLQKSGSLRSSSIDCVLFLCQPWRGFPHTVWAPPGSSAQQGTSSLPDRGGTVLIPGLNQGGQGSQDTLWEMKVVGGAGQHGAGQRQGQGRMSGFGSRVTFKLHDLGQASPQMYPQPPPGLSSSHIP